MIEGPPRPRIAFHWIENRGTDLLWYIGSPLLGLGYLPLIFFGDAVLARPNGDARFGLRALGQTYPLTAAVIVMGSWALLLDGPHFWSTLARTVLDPGEWRQRGRVLARSFLFFLAGPLLVILPSVVAAGARAAGVNVPSGFALAGPTLAFVAFATWAYYHVVRQHWGFFRLYKKRAGDFHPRLDSLDTWFFNLALFLPPVLLVTGHHYLRSGMFPDLGIHAPIVGSWSPAAFLHLAAWAVYAGVLFVYGASVIYLWRMGMTLNGPKLLLLAAVVPVHLIAFVSPVFPIFSQVLVGVGHSLQYQRIVWLYGRRKYAREGDGCEGEARWARAAFRNVAVYVLCGLAFTLLLMRGPWVDALIRHGGRTLEDRVGPLGAPLLGAVFMGWLFQHYYLDAKIWRVSRDAEVRRHLCV